VLVQLAAAAAAAALKPWVLAGCLLMLVLLWLGLLLLLLGVLHCVLLAVLQAAQSPQGAAAWYHL
jgi:hypothetical protein